MAGLYAPLPTLRRHPPGRLRTDRGRRGLLLLHRSGLSPHTPCQSPGALTYVATGAVRVVHHLFDDCFYTTRGVETGTTSFPLSTSMAANTPPALCGTLAIPSAISTPASVPISINSLKWPRWPMRNTLPFTLDRPAPSDMS